MRRRAVPHHFAPVLRGFWLIAALLIATDPVGALTLAELRAEKDLTPDRFIRQFANFKFELNRDVRPPEVFLKSQSGDCDDFATLAADVLRERGYTTRLVAVFMPHDVHVVCYVKEAGGYLDYNRRNLPEPLVKCKGDLDSIAISVAASFRATWRSASEFTYTQGAREFVMTAFR